MKEIKVIKLGGSTISLGEDNLFDFDYLARLKQVLIPQINQGVQFFIVLGGGYICRKMQNLAKNKGADDLSLHWIGLTVNVLNAYMARSFFAEYTDETVIKYEDYYNDQPLSSDKPIIFGGGGRPGHSGDVDAIKMAQRLGAKQIYSLKNVDGVYAQDPRKFPQAKRLDKVNWQEYLNIIGNPDKHAPGGNFPVDPIASKMASEAGISFYIVGANNLQDFAAALNNSQFTGTIISN